ncbi:retrovirus-related Pol polyprotein from transposon 17.6 [Trichonephila clavipes]|nr:retrovirus-related Pol polyprotein from transposon 17.6 [Trichonephila clavipes]
MHSAPASLYGKPDSWESRGADSSSDLLLVVYSSGTIIQVLQSQLKPRRLAPDRLKIAKAEFQHMIKLNHIRPSKSAYASPLHMVPKKDSIEWRPVIKNRKKHPRSNANNPSGAITMERCSKSFPLRPQKKQSLKQRF